MAQLEHVDRAHRDIAVEVLPASAVPEACLASRGDSRCAEQLLAGRLQVRAALAACQGRQRGPALGLERIRAAADCLLQFLHQLASGLVAVFCQGAVELDLRGASTERPIRQFTGSGHQEGPETLREVPGLGRGPLVLEDGEPHVGQQGLLARRRHDLEVFHQAPDERRLDGREPLLQFHRLAGPGEPGQPE